MNMYELKQEALTELKEAIEDDCYDDIQDGIHEIADGLCPIYYSDMADMMADDSELGFPDADYCCLAKTTAFDIIAWNIYNELIQYLNENLEELV